MMMMLYDFRNKINYNKMTTVLGIYMVMRFLSIITPLIIPLLALLIFLTINKYYFDADALRNKRFE